MGCLVVVSCCHVPFSNAEGGGSVLSFAYADLNIYSGVLIDAPLVELAYAPRGKGG